MPYNNQPISAQQELTGTSVLPLARVKKIIAMDEDIAQCSNSAAFAISIATEMFVRQLTEQAHNVVKSEKKPRRNLQYKDFANAVARIDNLEFLTDVIPKTTTYKQFKEKKAREAANGVASEAGQQTLDGKSFRQMDGAVENSSGTSFANGDVLDRQTAMQLPVPITPNSPPRASIVSPVNGSPMVDRTLHHMTQRPPYGDDVHMTG